MLFIRSWCCIIDVKTLSLLSTLLSSTLSLLSTLSSLTMLSLIQLSPLKVATILRSFLKLD